MGYASIVLCDQSKIFLLEPASIVCTIRRLNIDFPIVLAFIFAFSTHIYILSSPFIIAFLGPGFNCCFQILL